MKDIVVLSNRRIKQDDFDELSEIPWKIWYFTEQGVASTPYLPVNE